MFQCVLYYKRLTVVPPPKPSVVKMVDFNSPSSYDDYDTILDRYNESIRKYKKILNEYEKIKDNSVTNSFVMFYEDENFIKNVKEFEKNEFFIEWDSHSEEIIKNRMMKRTIL